MIRIGICDDNVNMLNNLNTIISDAFSAYSAKFDIKTFTNGQALLNAHFIEKFDILFLDIDMPGINGFDISKNLRDDYVNCFIIFVTSHAELVFDSMDFQPFNFIRKNCSIPLEDSIKQATAKLIKHMRQNEKLLLKNECGEDLNIHVKEIMYIENDKHYLKYYTTKSKTPFRIRGLISESENKLLHCDYVRIHKSYIVNMRYISKIDKTNSEVYIKESGKRLPMSKKVKKEVLERYMEYLRYRS